MRKCMSFVDERRNKILSLLQQYGSVRVSFLADELDTAALTIRRDLEVLADQGMIERRHGGASLRNPGSTPFSSTQVLHKQAIARAAAAMIEDGDSVFINTSSTALLTLRYITASNVTVITNNGKAMVVERNPQIMIVLTGGELRVPKESMVGDFAINNLNRVTASKCILGCAGLTLQSGVTTAILQEANINETMLRRASKRIVVADHTKIGKTHSFVSGGLDLIDCLITDSDAPKHVLERFRRQGIDVRTVDPVRKPD